MVVLSKFVLTAAVVAPAVAFDLSHIRFGKAVHDRHKAVAAAQGASEAEPRGLEARKVPTGFEDHDIVKHHFHSSQDVLQPRDATADTSAGADTSAASADTGAPDPANEGHHDAAHEPATPATPVTPPAAANAVAQAPPDSHPSSSAAAATNTHKVTPPAPKAQKQEPDFFSNLLNLVFKSPNRVDKAVTNQWDAVGKLFTGAPTTGGASATTAHKHSRRFEMEEGEELFERDLPEEDLELFERDFPEDLEELEARDFDEEVMELEARDFDDELELEARDFDDEMELEARDFDDELELEARSFEEDLEDLE